MQEDNVLDQMAGIGNSDDVLDQMAGITTQKQSAPEQEQGFFSRVGEDISKRWQNIKEIDAPTYGQASLRGAGQIAALGSDIIGQGLKSVYKTFTPQVTQDMFAEGAKNIGEYYAKPIGAVSEAYGSFAKENPNLSKDVEAVANIGSFVPLGKGTQIAGKEALNVASDVTYSVGKEAEQQIHNTVRNNIEKAIRPKVGGKSNFPRTEKYYERATEAVKNIIDNKENLELTTRSGDTIKGALPRSLKQFSEAIDQTKRNIYNEYHSMALAAKDTGAFFNASNIIKKLDGVEADIGHSKTVRDYASKLKDDILELDGQSPDIIEKRIKEYNSSLEGYYADRVTRAQAQIDASLAQALREELDNTITNAVGAGYQPLRNKLMTLKTIEKEVAHRVNISSRQNKKGLLDFTDIFTGGELVSGLMLANPAMIGRAVAQKGIKEWFKHINNPDYMTKQMFSGVEDIAKRQAQGFKSKSFQKAASIFPDNPLTPGDLPPIPPGKPYREITKVPSTEVKSPRWVGSSKTVSPMSPRTAKQLPSGQGFSLSGDPYTPEVIDAIFTAKSRPINALETPKREATLALSAGQGFELGNEFVTLKGLRNYQKALKRKIAD